MLAKDDYNVVTLLAWFQVSSEASVIQVVQGSRVSFQTL